MSSHLDLAFGIWTPAKIASAMKRYTNATAAPASAAIVRSGYRQLTGFGATPGQQISSAPPAAGPILLAVGGALLVLLALRVAAAWYVGKQFGRPVSGAVVGGIFGAPGLGVLSLFPDKRARPNRRRRRRRIRRNSDVDTSSDKFRDFAWECGGRAFTNFKPDEPRLVECFERHYGKRLSVKKIEALLQDFLDNHLWEDED